MWPGADGADERKEREGEAGEDAEAAPVAGAAPLYACTLLARTTAAPARMESGAPIAESRFFCVN